MLKIKGSDRIIIAGLPETGKTTLLKHLAFQLAPNILIVDPLDQYKEFPDKLRFIPTAWEPAAIEPICKQLHARTNMTLIVDEAELFFPQSRPVQKYAASLISAGRNWNIGIYATTRRIQEINKAFFDLSQGAFFFRCGLKSREYIARFLGNEYVTGGDSYNKTGYSLATLPQFHCLHVNLKTEDIQIFRLVLGGEGRLEPVPAT